MTYQMTPVVSQAQRLLVDGLFVNKVHDIHDIHRDIVCFCWTGIRM